MDSFSELSPDDAGPPRGRRGGPVGLVVRLRAEWRHLGATQETLAVMAGWALLERALEGVDLVGCDWRHEPPERRDAILLALVRLGQEKHPLAARVALQAMLPAVGRLAARLTWLKDRDSREAAVVAGMVEAIATYPLSRRRSRVAANLMHDAWHVAARENAMPGDVLVDPHLMGVHRHRSDDREMDASTELVAMLVTAVQDGVVTVPDSQFLLDTAGYGAGAAYARRTGTSLAMVRKRRYALLRRLCEKYGNCGVMIHPKSTH